jgi:hypothetical protein
MKNPHERIRVDFWQQKFHAFLKDARFREFKWGDYDCVMAATACIDLLTGSDYVAQAKERYPYTTEAEAREWMAKIGGITGLVSSFLGDPINWGALHIGDIVLVKAVPLVTEMEMLCIHDGVQLLAPASGGGLVRIPFQFAIHGWRVG